MVKKSYKPQAIITGAGSGIGRATAKRFYEAGYSVCCIDINQEEVEYSVYLESCGAPPPPPILMANIKGGNKISSWEKCWYRKRSYNICYIKRKSIF